MSMNLSLGLGLGGIPVSKGVGAYDPNAIGRAALTAKLTAGTSNINVGILGTSIGNASTEWARLLDPYFAAFAPNYLVRHRHYYDTGSVYASGSLGQNENLKLTGATAGTSRFADTFDRADGAIGTSSGGQSYGTVTSFSISGNKVIQTSFSNQLNPASGMPNDKHITKIDYTFGNNAGDGCRIYELFTSTSACIFLQLAKSGVVSIVYQPGAVQLIAVDTGADFAEGDTVNLTLIVDGDLVQAEAVRAGVTYAVAAQLSSAQKSALTGTKFAAGMLVTSSGATFDNLSVNDIAQARRLDIWNASIPGSTLANHVSKIATTLATSVVGTLDLLIIEPMSHNAGTDSPATFLSGIDSLVTAARGQQPNVPIVLLKENPQVSPSSTVAEHAARVAALDAYAAANGFGLIDGFTDYDTANIVSDGLGLHPNDEGSAYLALTAAESFDVVLPEAVSLFARFTAPPAAARKASINTLIGALKANGVWAKLDVLYVMAAHDAQAARQNWIQDAYNLTAVSSPTFTTDRGYAGNGTSSYINTNYNPTTAVSPKYVVDSGHIALWVRTERTGSSTVQMGSRPSGVYTQQTVINTRLAGTNLYTGRINGVAAIEVAVSSNAGLSLVSRTGSGDLATYRNGILIGSSGAAASDGIANASIAILARIAGTTPENYSSDEVAAASIGAGLTSDEQLAMYNAQLTYLQAVGAA